MKVRIVKFRTSSNIIYLQQRAWHGAFTNKQVRIHSCVSETTIYETDKELQRAGIEPVTRYAAASCLATVPTVQSNRYLAIHWLTHYHVLYGVTKEYHLSIIHFTVSPTLVL